MNALAINVVGAELAASAAFCREQRIGLEFTEYAWPKNLVDERPKDLETYAHALEGLPFLTVHGPFFDLVATSPDTEVVALTRRRHQTALNAAIHLRSKILVAHVNNNPLIRNTGYRKVFTQQMVEFWRPLADQAGRAGITIALENMWEAGPELQAEIIGQANHPHLKATFDNGHALVYSNVPAAKWIETLGTGLAHCHLHDNHGEQDEHLPVGTPGCKEDWPAYVAAIRAHAPQAILVLENDRLEPNRAALAQLRQYMA